MEAGERIELYEGIVFEVPSRPARAKCANFNLADRNQKWIRTEMHPKLVAKDKEEIDDLYSKDLEVRAWIDEEDKRCTDGFWLFINGELTYLTGDHYFYLNYFKLDAGYPEYRDADRRWFYVWEVCIKDGFSLGIIYLKKRRDGFSYRAVSCILNRARKTFNAEYGMISKTGEDVKALFQKLVYGFQELPVFFKPQVQSAEDVKKELFFKTPVQKISYKNRNTKTEISLNTKISWRNTSENAFDGVKLSGLIGDETGKFEEADFEKWMQIVEKCLTLGGGKLVVGKALIGTTVNEPEKESTGKKRRQGAKAFESVWRKSNSSEKNANNKTLSGLYRYFLPAYDGLEGFIGEYGESIIEAPTTAQAIYLRERYGDEQPIGATEYLTNVRNAYIDAGDMAGFYEECRMNPFEEFEAFREGANRVNTYDVGKLFQQLDWNKSYIDVNPNTLIRGNFVWKGGIRDGDVAWHPCEDGKWLVSWLPDPHLWNKSIVRYGTRCPANQELGCFGLDPYDNKTTTDNRKSNAASYGGRKFDPLNPFETGIPICEYVNRPSKPEVMWEDMILQCVFFGWELLCESNKIGTINHFRTRGYINYLMDRPEETQTDYSKANQKEKGIPMSGDEARQSLIYAVESFVINYVGLIQTEDTEPYMGKVYFDRLLKCLLDFDTDQKWTKFDEMVGFGLMLLGNRKYMPKLLKRPPMQLYKQYKVVGNSSVALPTPSAPKPLPNDSEKPVVIQPPKHDPEMDTWTS